jgi:TPR repeat protein
MGLSYSQGKGVEQDHDQAMAWYLKAAQQGDAQAQFTAAIYFEQGLGGVAVDHKAALDLYLKAAHQGMAQAQCNAGVYFSKGQGPRRTTSRLSTGTRRLRAKGTRTRSTIWP